MNFQKQWGYSLYEITFEFSECSYPAGLGGKKRMPKGISHDLVSCYQHYWDTTLMLPAVLCPLLKLAGSIA